MQLEPRTNTYKHGFSSDRNLSFHDLAPHDLAFIRVYQCSSVVEFLIVVAPLPCVHPWFELNCYG